MSATSSPMLLPEIRDVVGIARSYVIGEVHYSHLCASIAALNEALMFVPAEPRIRSLASEWLSMAERAWPEMAQIENPISEQEFKEWVKNQLTVFEPSR